MHVDPACANVPDYELMWVKFAKFTSKLLMLIFFVLCKYFFNCFTPIVKITPLLIRLASLNKRLHSLYTLMPYRLDNKQFPLYTKF